MISCKIDINVNIWRHSLNDPVEVVNFTIDKHDCNGWTWEDIEFELASSRWKKDIEGKLVDLEVAAIKLVSAWKDIVDTEKNETWCIILKEESV